jgi:hypothetical protein
VGLCRTFAALADSLEALLLFLPFMGLNQVTFNITQLLNLNNHSLSGKYSAVALRSKKLCSIPTILLR